MSQNIIQQLLSRFQQPQQPQAPIASPIPATQVLNTPQKQLAYSTNIQNKAIAQIRAAKPNLPASLTDDRLRTLYDLYGDQIIPAATNVANAIKGAVGALNPESKGQVLAAQTNTNDAQPVPSGIGLAMNYLKQQAGGQDPTQYYKAFQDPDFLTKVQAADQKKPGMGNLLLLQAFNESTLGNAGSNLFGDLPGGEGSGQQAPTLSPSAAVDYQTGPNVLSGGANKNMNVMGDKSPLTLGRVKQLYQSYNPEGAYLPSMLKTLGGN
jgi:hypothetical protein